MKNSLSKKYIILIVLVLILIITTIAGSVVYARYSQTVSAGKLSIQVNPSTQDSTQTTVGQVTYKEDEKMTFDKVHPVYPFG